MKIRKAIIPCGGLGTRFLPITKAVPKEILPIIDTPVLAYIVDELANSGIEQVLIIIGPGKESIRDYFLPSARWDEAVKAKPELAPMLERINRSIEFSFRTQNKPRGSGDAVLLAKSFTGNEPFCMCNGDDLIVSDEPVCMQLIRSYQQENATIVGVQQVAEEQTHMYGIISPTGTNGRRVYCNNIVEKPKSNPPSLYASLGRYVFEPEIYDRIERLEKENKHGEVGITEAICSLMRDGKAYAYEFAGKRYDMGDRFGALTATVELALQREDIGARFAQYLKQTIGGYEG